MVLLNKYKIKRLKTPVNGFFYKVEGKEHHFAVISKRKNGKVIHDLYLEFPKSTENVEVAIIKAIDNEEEIVDFFYACS